MLNISDDIYLVTKQLPNVGNGSTRIYQKSLNYITTVQFLKEI